MKILITICARGGSKGIPGKNIRSINGLPLIAYTIKTAKAFSETYAADIALSTDDPEIRNITGLYGLSTVYTRPSFLATDNAGKVDVINHLLKFEEETRKVKYDMVLDLDITSPLRTVQDLISAFELISKDRNALNLFSVSQANRNPYFNMVEKNEEGYYSTIKKGEFLTRQSAPKVYDMNASFYFYRRNFFELNLTSSITERTMIYVVPHLCFDLDHEVDFEFMTFLVENNKLGFDL